MDFTVGNLVTRKSYNNDTVFKIVDIVDDVAILKGVTVRLCADSDVMDLSLYNKNEKDIIESDNRNFEDIRDAIKLDRSEYFYLPGKILHIDGDKEYLDRCLKYYNNVNLMAMGICEDEVDVPIKIRKYLEEYNPNILVITGHDAYYKKKGSVNDINKDIDLKNIIASTKYGKEGIGGIITKGTMYMGYPR